MTAPPVATVARTISATWEPVGIREAKKHLEIPDAATAHDGILSTLIETAREIVEDDTGLWLPTSTGVLYRDAFPEEVVFPVRPISSITSAQYLDTDGTLQTWSSANYSLDSNNRTTPYWYWAYNVSAPSVRDIENTFKITFVGGYATQALVPEKLKQMVLIKLSQLFIDREGMENVKANPRGSPWEFESAYQALVRRYQRSTYP